MRQHSANLPRLIQAFGALAPVLGAGLGCGYQDVAEELTETSRIDAPGYRLAEGSFKSLRLVADEDALHVLADTDAGRALTSINVLGQHSCEIPNVTSYSLYYRTTSSSPRVLPYLETVNDQGRGTLKFASLECQPYALEVPDAELPFDGAGARGLALRSGKSLMLVEPVTGFQQVLVADYMYANSFSANGKSGWVVRGDQKVVLFDADWNETGRLGDGVDNLLGSSYFTDKAGLHRIDPAAVSEQLIQADACWAAWGRGENPTVVFYYSPCAEQKLAVYQESKSESIALPGVTAMPGQVAFVDQESYRGLFLLGDVDSNGLGTLVASTLDGTQQVPIAQHADLDWALWREYQLGEAKYTGLLALVDVANDAGRLVSWQMGATSTQEVATSVSRWSRSGSPLLGGNPVVVNAVEKSGDLAVICRRGTCPAEYTGATVVAKNIRQFTLWVAGEDYKTRSGPGASLVLADYDGTSGTLLAAVPSFRIGRTFQPIAPAVPLERYALLSLFPGAAYIAGYDPATKSGRLEYTNFDLGSVGVIAGGVTEFTEVLLPQPGLLYVVGEGEVRGIWHARGK